LVKISIIIPVYNTEKYVAECIESCLNQTYKDFEIIVINDGSTDKSVDIISEYHKNNKDKITLIHKENGGTGSALNTGFERMAGEWFKWVSADDVLYPTALETMMDLIEKIPDNKQYIFYTNYNIIDEDGGVIKPFDEPNRTTLTRDLRNVELMNNFYGNASSSLIHKSLMDKVGLFKKMSFAEDLEYWLRACIKHKFTLFHLPFRSIKYRTHKDSLTSTKNINDDQRILHELRDEYSQYLTEQQKIHLKKLEKPRSLKRRILHKMPDGIRNPIVKIYRKVK